MPLPSDLLDLPAPEGARRLARARLKEAVAASERLADAADAEALHDFRVALRRLRSVLRSHHEQLADTVSRKRRRQLRDVAAETGVARDLEVHLDYLREVRTAATSRERAGIDWLLKRLEARMTAETAELLGPTLKTFQKVAATLEAEFGRWHQTLYLDDPHPTPSMATVTASLMRQAVIELEERLSRVESIEDEVPSHEARIAGKRLRYLLEPVLEVLDEDREPLRQLKQLQDALGDLHDSQVFSRELVAASADAAAEVARSQSSAVLKGTAKAATRRRPTARDPRAGLLALAERVRDRGTAAWQEVESQWLADRAATFLDDVRTLAARLEGYGAPTVEIERKYLLSALPDMVKGHSSAELAQGYLPGRKLIERVRRVRDDGGERWFRTVKGGRGVHRLEVEEETTRDVFETLWSLTEGRRVRKRRWFVQTGDHTWEIDDFADRTLFLAEIELTRADEVVHLPDWLAPLVVREVTAEDEYANYALAK